QLATLTSPTFQTHVLVICHGTYITQADGTTKIFPQGIGKALSPIIPQYFPNYIRMTKRAEKRTMQLTSDAIIDLATTRPDVFDKDLDPENGLAEFFAGLTKEPPAKSTTHPPARPETLILRKTLPRLLARLSTKI